MTESPIPNPSMLKMGALALGAYMLGRMKKGKAAIGLAIAAGALELIHVYGSDYIPRIDEIRLGGPAIAWLASLALVSAIVVGLVPAIHGARLAGHRQVSAGGRSVTDSPAARHVRRVLVGVEFAIATPLIVAAVLVLTTLERLRDVPVGVDSAQVLTASIALPQGTYPDATAMRAFWTRALDRLAAPEVGHRDPRTPAGEHPREVAPHAPASGDQDDLPVRGRVVGRHEPGFQGTSATPARWLTARARTNRRSLRRFR